ncbi:hypothetical protein GTR02_14725 [Kineococcus sp. R8]|uniref:hypothetical protein n=1 Tax=Kineococcus siccus TaxID=2696567 RepID=UPI0014125E3E|nr:hypothetical protein [Kineococcus siccus]NAZ83071.1 hypothetical protein [Kineococcus siccus]
MAGGRWSGSYEARYRAARARGEPSPFAQAEEALARRGDGPTAAPAASAGEPERTAGRHCWVRGPTEDPGPFPGLLLAWRRGPDGWLGRVAYVLPDEHARPVLIDTWVPAASLRPAS